MQADEKHIRIINHIILKLDLSDLNMLGRPWVVTFFASSMVVVFKRSPLKDIFILKLQFNLQELFDLSNIFCLN